MGNKTPSASFAAYAENYGEIPFSEWLRERSEPEWTDATRHRFIEELGADTLGDKIFRRYLIQDHAFLETGASLTGYAVGQAHTMDEKARLTDALSVLTGSENELLLAPLNEVSRYPVVNQRRSRNPSSGNWRIRLS